MWCRLFAFGFLWCTAAHAETWQWDSATGPVTSYQVEDSLGVTRTTSSASITIDPTAPMRKVRARATDGVNFGPWSDWSFRAGYNPDVDGDGFVMPSDLTEGFLPAYEEGRTWPH